MRESQSDDLYIESSRCLGISNWNMRFVQVHVTRLHALQLDIHFDSPFRIWSSISLGSQQISSR
jgi:hypothetical protein